MLDPFGGSNTTGAGAEALKRQWIVTEPRDDFIAGSYGRFLDGKLRRPDGLALDPHAIVRYLEQEDAPKSRAQIARPRRRHERRPLAEGAQLLDREGVDRRQGADTCTGVLLREAISAVRTS